MACYITVGEESASGSYRKKFWKVEVLALTAQLRPLYLSHDRTAVEQVLGEHRKFAGATCRVRLTVDVSCNMLNRNVAREGCSGMAEG